MPNRFGTTPSVPASRGRDKASGRQPIGNCWSVESDGGGQLPDHRAGNQGGRRRQVEQRCPGGARVQVVKDPEWDGGVLALGIRRSMGLVGEDGFCPRSVGEIPCPRDLGGWVCRLPCHK
ncbi:hypothetical protein GCM10009557_06950 [Virgisporangium ochraceum]|uniref:Uncharacterized protein n=1 Tax=Virgisporangium ochraceum TaxID=65505 RepID=A0A8J4A064_9ACTN|nr:hypothetical protein Voc01_076830 [Virgisporangium ochraceum]